MSVMSIKEMRTTQFNIVMNTMKEYKNKTTKKNKSAPLPTRFLEKLGNQLDSVTVTRY